jgi:hypothetical protein
MHNGVLKPWDVVDFIMSWGKDWVLTCQIRKTLPEDKLNLTALEKNS